MSLVSEMVIIVTEEYATVKYERVRNLLEQVDCDIDATSRTVLFQRLHLLEELAAKYHLPDLLHEVIAHDLCRSQLGSRYNLKRPNHWPIEVREMSGRLYVLREAMAASSTPGLSELMISGAAGGILRDDFRFYLILLISAYVILNSEPDPVDESARHTADGATRLLLPVARRLGLFDLVRNLADNAYRITSPALFYQLDHWRQNAWATTASDIETILARLRERWEQLCPRIEPPRLTLFRRDLHSLIGEIEEQDGDIDERLRRLSRFNAWRIVAVVNEEDEGQCYRMLQVLHEVGRADHSGVMDSLTHPESNGYSALRSRVTFNLGRLKVKITTPQRDKVNTLGVLAPECLAPWCEWPPSREGIRNLSVGGATLLGGLVSDNALITVKTPQGEQISLPEGSSTLDYAFSIHSTVGFQFQSATVLRDGQRYERRGPDYSLQHGDVVTVETSTSVRPEPGWVDYVRTERARSRIQRELRRSPIAIGERAIQRELDNINWPGDRSELPARLARLMSEHGWGGLKELYASVGKGQLPPPYVMMRIIAPEAGDAPELYEPYMFEIPEDTQRQLEGLNPMLRMAGCCQARPPQPISADLKQGDLIIHLGNCPKRGRGVSSEMTALAINWKTIPLTTHPINIVLQADDHAGLLSELLECFTRRRINLSKVVAIRRRESDGMLVGHIELTADIANLNQFQSIIAALHGIAGLEVRHTDGNEKLANSTPRRQSLDGIVCPFKTSVVAVRTHFAVNEHRRNILERIIQPLYRNEHLALTLCAPQRIGKSSLLNYLRSERRLRQFYPVHHHISGISSPIAFFQGLTEHIIHDLSEYRAEMDEEPLNLTAPTFTAEDYLDAGDIFTNFIVRLQRRLHRPLLLMLDEFARPTHPDFNGGNQAGMTQFYDFWKYLLNHLERPHLIFSWPRTRFDRTTDAVNALYKVESAVDNNVSLDNLDLSTTIHYMSAMFSPYFHFEPEELATRCYQLTAGHPLLLQILGQRLWEQTFADRHHVIYPADFDRLIKEQLRHTSDSMFDHLWATGRSEQKLIGKQVAQLQQTPGADGAVAAPRLLADLRELYPAMFADQLNTEQLIDDLVERNVLAKQDDSYYLAAEMMWWRTRL